MTAGRGPPDASAHAPRRRSAWSAAIVGEVGATGQASVAAAFAWAVSVAPCAWARPPSIFAQVTSVLAIGVLAAGLALERLSTRGAAAGRVHPAIVWGFALLCAVTWVLAPDALSPRHFSNARSAASILGWAMFAHACAAPALAPTEAVRIEPGAAREQLRQARGGEAIILCAALCALGLLAAGSEVEVAERAVLIKVVATACGVALVGSAARLAVALQRQRRASSGGPVPYASLVLVLALIGCGVALAVLRQSAASGSP